MGHGEWSGHSPTPYISPPNTHRWLTISDPVVIVTNCDNSCMKEMGVGSIWVVLVYVALTPKTG